MKNIIKINPDLLIIGMGAPKQDKLCLLLKELGYAGTVYTCGGFFHQTVMKVGDYYPSWINKSNLRFVYRMYKEPNTIVRYFIYYPVALALLLILVFRKNEIIEVN